MMVDIWWWKFDGENLVVTIWWWKFDGGNLVVEIWWWFFGGNLVVKEWWWTFGKEKLGCQILQGGNGNLDAPAFGNGKLGFHTSSSRKLTSCFNIVAEQIRNTQKNTSRQKEFRTGYTGLCTCLDIHMLCQRSHALCSSPSNLHHHFHTTQF